MAERLGKGSARTRAALEALGIESTLDLIDHLPDRVREARTVTTLMAGEAATIAVEVEMISARSVRRRKMRPLVEAKVFDETGSVRATFFNQPWLVDRYPPGTRLVLHGALRAARGSGAATFAVAEHAAVSGAGWSSERGGRRALPGAVGRGARWRGRPGKSSGSSMAMAPGSSMAMAPGSSMAMAPGSGTVVPHYPATEGISSTQIAVLVGSVGETVAGAQEPLPAVVRVGERLPDRAAALLAIHFPADGEEWEQGRRRLAFDELLLGQLALRRGRAHRTAGAAPELAAPGELTARWRRMLPFELTADQVRAIEEIDRDIAKTRPMQRLLMGEVGSGKTVVALYAMLRAVESGMQAALMAPTETLAEQHFATLAALAPEGMVSCALITGSTPQARRRDAIAKLASGELQLTVGTHALIEQDVRFARLGLVVVDEQHRFGVRQRSALADRGSHSLHMTATPIPRTLALINYGDLDVTQLRSVPAGRGPVSTHIASTKAERARAYERVREELSAGRQAFVVCPLVSESEQLQAKAAVEEYERLREGELKEFRVGLLHGQLRPVEKQAAMAGFAAGDVDVLVATTVIEVGIDVPNATVILVEDAERYGISQLHQLRGRVGRGDGGGLCLLFGSKSSPRLRALAGNADGFELAEIDLRLRGEGEIEGAKETVRQSGDRGLRVARLPHDADLLDAANGWARELLERDPDLSSPEGALLAVEMERAFGPQRSRPIPA